VVVDDGVTGQSGGKEGLERDGAEKAAGEHCFKRECRKCKDAMSGRLTGSQDWV
jgi:hypothetical protein